MKRLFTIFVSASAILVMLNEFSVAQDRGDRGDRRDRGGFGGDSGRGDRGGSGGPPPGFGGGGFGGPPGGFGGGGFGGPPGGFGGGGFGGPPGGFGGGGFGGGDRESRFGSMMDSNGNGKVDQEELDRMPSFVRDMMKARGVELKAGMSLDDMRNSFRSSFNPGNNSPGGQPNDPNRKGANGAVVLTPYKMKPKKPLTITLPPAYSEVDTDFDGQIAMHEWMLTRRVDLEKFDSMDIDSDGYLIPEELAIADAAATNPTAVASTAKKRLLIVNATPTKATATSNNGQPGNGQPGSTPPNGQDNGNRGGWGNGDPASMASESFKRLDGNGDGFVDTTEWQGSRRTRGMFEQAGIRLERMSLEQFSQHYVRLMSSGGGR